MFEWPEQVVSDFIYLNFKVMWTLNMIEIHLGGIAFVGHLNPL